MNPLDSIDRAAQRQPVIRSGGSRSELVVRAVPWFAALAVLAWGLAGALASSSQWGDNFEQFVWAHGLEWGYHKHPPLPTWMLAGVISIWGPSPRWAEMLGIACVVGTGLFTYRIGVDLFDRPTAALALLFWGLQAPFSARCQLFNHNTVLMLCTAATAWSLLQALRADRAARWWVATGVLAALSILSKYQALVPLAGLVVAVSLSGELAARRARDGVLAAALVCAAIVAPHAVWVAQHEWTTLAYASRGGSVLSASERAWSVLSFLGQQLRLVAPAVVFAVALVALDRSGAAAANGSCARPSARQRAWMIGLVLFPFCATVLVAPVFALKLQNHWGYQALQFAGLWLACRVRPHALRPRPSWIVAALATHVLALSLALATGAPDAGPVRTRHDVRYPAQELARAVRRDWEDETWCPLAFVVGPTMEAGIVSVYNGGVAAVLEHGDFSKSPWIAPVDIERRGAVYVAPRPDRLPTRNVTRVGALEVGPAAGADDRVHWAIVPPKDCPAAVR